MIFQHFPHNFDSNLTLRDTGIEPTIFLQSGRANHYVPLPSAPQLEIDKLHIWKPNLKWAPPCENVSGCLWTANAYIRLRNRAVRSGSSLSSNRIIGYYKMYEWRAKAQIIFCECADDLNLHVTRFRRDFLAHLSRRLRMMYCNHLPSVRPSFRPHF